MSRTAQFADVVLPAAPSVEKDGTFTSTERRIQRFHRVLEPLGDCRPDWQILTDLARRMGDDWGYSHPAEIMAEAASIAKIFAGVSYARLEGWKSLQWPVKPDGTDTPLLYTEEFHMPGGRAKLHPLKWEPPAEATDDVYDLALDNGRLLEHFQSMNQTGQGPRVRHEVPNWFVEVSPKLARERGIEDGTWVRVTSRRDSVELQAVVTDRVHDGVLYMPIHHAKPAMNKLTGDHHDPVVNTPGYKETAVKLEVLDRPKGAPPLPYQNYRYGHPTPNGGPPVEDKWARDDYVTPPAHESHPERI